MGLPEIDAAKLCLVLMLQSKVVPLVQNDAASSADLLSLCSGILDMIKRKPENCSAVQDGALDELNRVAMFFVAMSDTLKNMEKVDIDLIQDVIIRQRMERRHY